MYLFVVSSMVAARDRRRSIDAAFNYVPRQHDVLRVTRDAFQTCEPTAGQTVRKWASGRDVVDLAATGDYYFICNITGHCLGGMKFSVAVSAPPPPPPSPPPPPALPTSMPPPPSSGACGRRLARISGLAVIGLWISLLS
ncbi:basic blue protein-like [Hordeum vulgare]|nr:basic blue protein-like [Hordeum vulgare]